jgi:hypothetical protein
LAVIVVAVIIAATVRGIDAVVVGVAAVVDAALVVDVAGSAASLSLM